MMRYVQLVALVTMVIPCARGANCMNTSVGFPPLTDLGAGLYLDTYQGGLYPGGVNTIPADHAAAGAAAASRVDPRDVMGLDDPDGRIVLLSIGMSNAAQEFSRFIVDATSHPDVNVPAVVLVNGAKSGQAASNWVDPAHANYDRIRDEELTPSGLSEAQVQAVWLKVATGFPARALPDPEADAFVLLQNLGDITRALHHRYPNLELLFVSSRTYGGYADVGLNPEPFAYESGFSVKWLVEAQIRQMRGEGVDIFAGDVAAGIASPWLTWGPYLWADGLIPRGDGLVWECDDFQSDGTHPSGAGRRKVSALMVTFFLNSSHTAPWFRVGGCPADGDVNGNGAVTPGDALLAFQHFLQQTDLDSCAQKRADIDGTPGITPSDALAIFDLFLSNS